MTETPKPLPCQCGSSDVFIDAEYSRTSGAEWGPSQGSATYTYPYMKCKKCGLQSGKFPSGASDAEVIKDWNKPTSLNRLRAEAKDPESAVGKLVEALKDIADFSHIDGGKCRCACQTCDAEEALAPFLEEE